MLIKNAEIFTGRSFLHGDIRFGETIEEIGRIDGPADLDAGGCYVIPGLVDIHTHGAMGTSPTANRRDCPRWRSTTPPTASPPTLPPP